jgi:Fe-S-cluster containining protein
MPDYATIAVGATRAALAILRDEPRTPELVDRLVDVAHRLAHSVNDQLQSDGDPAHVHLPVCREGCASCCYADVLASTPEVLRIARHLRATRSAEELARLRAHLADVAARTKETSTDEWRKAKIPCPLLDEAKQTCTVHDVRPAACRAYNSTDVAKCLEHLEKGDAVLVPANGVQQKSILAVGIGLATGCRLNGLAWEGRSLTAGLAAALADDEGPTGATRDWLAGGRPLDRAETRTSRAAAPFQAKDVDQAIKGVRAFPNELPQGHAVHAAPTLSEDEARRERNRKKRQRKGR